MSQTYNTKVNEQFEFAIDEQNLHDFDVLPKGNQTHHLVSENQSFHINVLKSDFGLKKYTISVNGNPYEVSIKDELDQLIEKMGLGIKDKQKDSDVKSPMPGLILEINVTEGQEVKEGDELLILEAMKMENILTSPKDGVVKAIHATKGNSVEKGAILIELE